MNKIILEGKFTQATIFTTSNTSNQLEPYAQAQIQLMCDFVACEGCQIRVMPDVHPGKGCVVGLTMTLKDQVMPNLVGFDIGCGVSVFKLNKEIKDFKKLDKVIHTYIPAGFALNTQETDFDFQDLCCLKHISVSKAKKSLGTLGGGNHFIEIAQNKDLESFLIIHTGSRNLGREVCAWYLKLGQQKDIPYELTFLKGDLAQQYLNDMRVVQHYAQQNRQQIAKMILKKMKLASDSYWESVHNYIDLENAVPVLRKGAIAAAKGQPVIIPSNMRDGSIIGLGKGNPDWNFSAPHGSGRIGSRSQVKEQFTLTQFKKSMEGIYSTCISQDTLDEAPFAYRAQKDILEAIEETVEVIDILKPVYNFKAKSQ